MYARSGFARSAATRSDFVLEALVATIDGVDVTKYFVKGTARIKRALNDQPDSASFQLYEIEPLVGQEIIIGNGSIDNRLFGGIITERKQPSMKQIGGVPTMTFWDVNCADWLFELQGIRVMKKYPRQPAHLIFLDLAQTYCQHLGYSVAHVKSGAPEIDEIVFDMDTTLPSAFARLAARCDPTWHFNVDANKALHFFDVDDYRAQPRVIEVQNLTYDKLAFSETMVQMRNRVTIEGGGGQAEAPAAAGSSWIQVNECGWYRNPNGGEGGKIKIGPQILTYGGRTATSGVGLLVGIPIIGPDSLKYDVLQGDTVSVVVTVEDTAAQAALRELMGGDGIRHYFIKDGTLSIESITAKAEAELHLFTNSIKSGGYESYDKVLDTGRIATIVLPGRNVQIQATITEVEIWFESPHKTKRRANFNSAIRVDFTDVIRSLGKQQQ